MLLNPGLSLWVHIHVLFPINCIECVRFSYIPQKHKKTGSKHTEVQIIAKLDEKNNISFSVYDHSHRCEKVVHKAD